MSTFLVTETDQIKKFVLENMDARQTEMVVGDLEFQFKRETYEVGDDWVIFAHGTTYDNGRSACADAVILALTGVISSANVPLDSGMLDNGSGDEYFILSFGDIVGLVPEKAPTTREDYLALFNRTGEAIEFEDAILQSGGPFPTFVQAVIDGKEAGPEYWGWLIDEKEQADFSRFLENADLASCEA